MATHELSSAPTQESAGMDDARTVLIEEILAAKPDTSLHAVLKRWALWVQAHCDSNGARHSGLFLRGSIEHLGYILLMGGFRSEIKELALFFGRLAAQSSEHRSTETPVIVPAAHATRVVRIERCSVPGAWYADRVGQVVNSFAVDGYGYWTRDTGALHCAQWIKLEDGLPL